MMKGESQADTFAGLLRATAYMLLRAYAIAIPSVCLSVRPSRDVHETFQAETETRPETHRSETETRLRRWAFCPRRDRDQDVSATETLAETYGEKH